MANRFRPYYPQQNVSYSGSLEAGENIGKMLSGAISQSMAQAKLNKVANQLLNQQFPGTTTPQGNDPDPDPVDQDTGQPITDPNAVVPDVGLPDITTPGNFQGGIAEFQLRQAAAKDALETAYKQAQMEGMLARTKLLGRKKAGAGGLELGGGSAAVWTKGGDGGGGDDAVGQYDEDGNPIDDESSNTDTNTNTDVSGNIIRVANPDLTMKNFRSDYGADSLTALTTGKATVNANGDYEYTAKDGSKVTIPGADAKKVLNARDINRQRHGFSSPSPSRGTNMNSTAKPGSLENPAYVETDEDIAALPPYFYYQKRGGPVLQRPPLKRRH